MIRENNPESIIQWLWLLRQLLNLIVFLELLFTHIKRDDSQITIICIDNLHTLSARIGGRLLSPPPETANRWL